MKFKIIDMKKFIKTLILTLIVIFFFIFILINTTYSRTEVKYKEEYIYQGDTLWSMVQKESNSNLYIKGRDIRDVIQEIRRINNINNENLKIGQKILIPTI